MPHQKSDTFVDIRNARYDDQRQVMEKIMANNECPFCLENLKKYHLRPILKEGTHWIITENAWPYDNTRVHLLAIARHHVQTISELPAGAGDELLELTAWAEKEYQLAGGAVCMRFGDTTYSAGSVIHLHAQIISPDVDKPGFEPVRFKIGRHRK